MTRDGTDHGTGARDGRARSLPRSPRRGTAPRRWCDRHPAVQSRHPATCRPRRAGRQPAGPDRGDPPRVPRRRRRHHRDRDVRGEPHPPRAPRPRRSQAGRLVRRGAQLAREARDVSGRDVLVAGSIGPLGAPTREILHLSDSAVRAAFREVIDGLLEGGVDLLWFETFALIDHLAIAIDEARSVTADLPIVALLTSARRSRSPTAAPGPAARDLAARVDLDVIGVNCGAGPVGCLDALVAMDGRAGAILPNAGLPQRIEGQFVYAAGPDYLGRMVGDMLDAGAAIVGGCCGTTPEHIAAMRAAIDARVAGATAPAPAVVPRAAARRIDPRRGRRRDRHRPAAVPAPPGPRGRPLRDLGRDRPAALGAHRAHDRGRPAAPRRRRRRRQRQRFGHGPGAHGRAGRRVRDPARPRPRVRGPRDDPRPEPHGARVGAARRACARRPRHPGAHRRPATDRRLPVGDGRVGRRFDRARRDPDPAQPGRGRGRLADRPASRRSPSRAHSTRLPRTRRPNGTASSERSRPAPT